MNTPLRQARERRGLTLQAVADAVGLDTGNLSRIERGRQVPSGPIANRIAAFFDGEVTACQIMCPEGFGHE